MAPADTKRWTRPSLSMTPNPVLREPQSIPRILTRLRLGWHCRPTNDSCSYLSISSRQGLKLFVFNVEVRVDVLYVVLLLEHFDHAHNGRRLFALDLDAVLGHHGDFR